MATCAIPQETEADVEMTVLGVIVLDSLRITTTKAPKDSNHHRENIGGLREDGWVRFRVSLAESLLYVWADHLDSDARAAIAKHVHDRYAVRPVKTIYLGSTA